MIINHNLAAMFAQRQQGLNGSNLEKVMEKLSSGQRINRAGDDASGLAVSEKMRSQIRGLNRAAANAVDGISFIQTTEAYLSETTDVLQRLRELAVQAANGIYSSEDRLMIQVEVSQLVDEVNRVASHAQFNGMNVLTGRFGRDGQRPMTFQIGANMDQSIEVFVGAMDAATLGLLSGQGTGDKLSMDDAEAANRAIGTLDAALRMVNKQRADLGAAQNRLEFAKRGIDVAAENIQASESRIRDANMAREMVDYTRDQVLLQASTALLAQANVNSNLVLYLLNGR